MDKKSKILISLFFVAIVASALVTYYRYIVLKDFSVTSEPIVEESM